MKRKKSLPKYPEVVGEEDGEEDGAADGADVAAETDVGSASASARIM